MTNLEIAAVVAKLIGYLTVILAAFFGMKSAIEGLRKDYQQSASQVERIETKVDDISETLTTIQANAARHDQRATDIQERVISIEGRVTYLERK